MSEVILSPAVLKIRTEWAISDAKRDEGLTTPENIVRYDNISYGSHGEYNLLDVYYTKDTVSPKPVIVNIHGGGWVYGSKEIYQFYCMSLAQRGFTVVNFNYRLAPENRYPAALEDINSVFSFLEKEGAKYMADTNNVFVVGDSAGGQLASHYLTIMTNPSYAKLFSFKTPDVTVRGCGLNCGLYDARMCAERGLSEYIGEYLGKNVTKEDEALLNSLDVLKYMTKDFPPAYVMSAINDFLLPEAEPMYKHLQKLGVECELGIYGTKEQEEVAHVFHVDCKLKEAAECNDAECNFFKKYIK